MKSILWLVPACYAQGQDDDRALIGSESKAQVDSDRSCPDTERARITIAPQGNSDTKTASRTNTRMTTAHLSAVKAQVGIDRQHPDTEQARKTY